MGEIITLHIGQAGINTGAAFWEELIRENGREIISEAITTPNPPTLILDGRGGPPNNELVPKYRQPRLKYKSQIRPIANKDAQPPGDYPTRFFQEMKDGSLVPRTIFVDQGNDPIEPLMNSMLGGCFKRNHSFLYNNRDSGGVSLEVFYDTDLLGQVGEAVRKHSEATDRLSSIILTYGIAGGVGCGLTKRIIGDLQNELGPKTTKMGFVVFPSIGNQEGTIEPYNSALAIQDMRKLQLAVMVDNKAILNQLYYLKGIEEPTMSDINKCIAQLMSNVTASTRFSSTSSQGLQSMVSSLV